MQNDLETIVTLIEKVSYKNVAGTLDRDVCISITKIIIWISGTIVCSKIHLNLDGNRIRIQDSGSGFGSQIAGQPHSALKKQCTHITHIMYKCFLIYWFLHKVERVVVSPLYLQQLLFTTVNNNNTSFSFWYFFLF